MSTLDEVMTDEAIPQRTDVVFYDDYKAMARNALRAELREPLRALRESHDALEAQLRKQGRSWGESGNNLTQGWHTMDCARADRCTSNCREARAALEKAQAVKHG